MIDLMPYLAVAEELEPYGDRSKLRERLGPELSGMCSEVSRILKETGALLVKDPRCTAEDNDRFIDMMERYFESPVEFKRLQERPHLHYQVEQRKKKKKQSVSCWSIYAQILDF